MQYWCEKWDYPSMEINCEQVQLSQDERNDGSSRRNENITREMKASEQQVLKKNGSIKTTDGDCAGEHGVITLRVEGTAGSESLTYYIKSDLGAQLQSTKSELTKRIHDVDE